MSNRIIDYKWFYDLAADIDTLVDKVNKDLGDDIYYTFWNAPDGVVRIKDSRSEDVFYDWRLDPSWCSRAWKDLFRKRFNGIIELLKGKYKYILKTEYGKTESRRSLDVIAAAEKGVNNMLKEQGSIYLDDVYKQLGISPMPWTSGVRWEYPRIFTSKVKETEFKIERVIFNNPATIILWKDGSKTVVKCSKNETYDPEKGLAMALVKHFLGDKGNYNNLFRHYLKEVEE